MKKIKVGNYFVIKTRLNNKAQIEHYGIENNLIGKDGTEEDILVQITAIKLCGVERGRENYRISFRKDKKLSGFDGFYEGMYYSDIYFSKEGKIKNIIDDYEI